MIAINKWMLAVAVCLGLVADADAPAETHEADVVVYGDASGGVTAAVQAARMGKSVTLASLLSLGCAANVTHPIPTLDTKGDVYKTEGPNDPLIYDPVVGHKTAVLLYVNFPNIPQAGDTKERGQKLLAGGKFQKLFKDQSYGKLSLDIKHIHGWRTMPKQNKAYDPTTTEGHREMFVDAFALYPEINMLDYDYILISMPGRGNFAFGERDDKAIPYRGKKINTAVNQGSMSYFTLAHELAHCMGLPDLFSYGDANGPKNPLGPWDIMSGPATGFLGWHRHKFGWLDADRKTYLFKMLQTLEKISIAFCDHVIISNDIWREKLIRRSTHAGKCTAILNYPDNTLFSRATIQNNPNKFVMIYPGTLGWHQGLDIAIRAFNLIADRAPEAEFYIFGNGSYKNKLGSMISDFGLQSKIFLKETIPFEQVHQVMANANLGIVPKRNDSFGGEAFSTKILEFMSVGVPVIVSETKIDQYYFDDSLVQFFEPGNEKDLAEKMMLLIKNNELRQQLTDNASKFIQNNYWDVKKHIYLDLVDSLVSPPQLAN